MVSGLAAYTLSQECNKPPLLPGSPSSPAYPTKPHAHSRLSHARMCAAVQERIQDFSWKL